MHSNRRVRLSTLPSCVRPFIYAISKSRTAYNSFLTQHQLVVQYHEQYSTKSYTPNCNNVIERKQKAKKRNRNKLAM